MYHLRSEKPFNGLSLKLVVSQKITACDFEYSPDIFQNDELSFYHTMIQQLMHFIVQMHRNIQILTLISLNIPQNSQPSKNKMREITG